MAVELIGMAVASGIILLLGTAGAIYVDMATFILSALTTTTVNTREQNLVKKKFYTSEYINTSREGLVYVSKDSTAQI